MRQRRSLSFRKGKETIKRKAKELSILCDIPVCALITSPINGEIETWPESPSELKTIFQMYREKFQFFDRQRYADPAEEMEEDDDDDEDEIMEWLNDKIAAVDDRIRVLNGEKLRWPSGSGTHFQSDCMYV
ncbi:hypothetical protein M9H77_05345 [Catharanthus roseus]|uniref:Uncharacterized protein n=1 Tax=Catharanthus roseus TaxID=4058 RepID=A0ACC0CH05_CATRO|nr:hypothetical protein M9H77_05345 [Catharanthus roseus]